MSTSRPTVAVLATLDTKGNEARFVADVLARAGATPWIVDLSMKARRVAAPTLRARASPRRPAHPGKCLTNLAPGRRRRDGRRRQQDIARASSCNGDFAGAIGLGGANGTNLVCSILRALPYLVPKVMISTVAGTAAVQWYVAESDIAMYPSIGDVSLNRITKAVMENAALRGGDGGQKRAARRGGKTIHAPLVAVSSFGGTAACVERVSRAAWKPWATRSSCFTPRASAASRSNGWQRRASSPASSM